MPLKNIDICSKTTGGMRVLQGFLGPYYNTAPGYPKRDHNFDNHPHRRTSI